MQSRLSFAAVFSIALLFSISSQGATPNELFVNRVYLDLLGRPADPTALSQYVPQLDANTLTRFNFAANITSSDEFLSDEVSAFYQHLLHRAADPSGATLNLNLLKTPSGTFEQVQSGLAGSAEYYALHGSTNDSFISAAYSDFLNRAAGSSDIQFGENFLQSGTRPDFATVILTSSEYRQDLVNGYYLQLLHRPADPTGLNTFVSALNSGAKDQFVIDSLISSQEYFNNAVPEPASMPLLICPLLMLMFWSRHALSVRRCVSIA